MPRKPRPHDKPRRVRPADLTEVPVYQAAPDQTPPAPPVDRPEDPIEAAVRRMVEAAYT